jgi:hypothetical protein
MKTLGQIPHPEMLITIFMWNNKYLLKFEAGPYEQVYKIDAGAFDDANELKSRISAGFTESVAERFRQMNKDFSDLMR